MSSHVRVPKAAVNGSDTSEDLAIVGKEARRLLESTRQRKGPRLHPALRFPLVVVLSLAWTAIGYGSVAQWTRDDLLAFSTSLPRTQAAALLAWRVSELALGWFGNYDSYDLAALSILSHSPTAYLLSAFYGTPPLTAATCLLIDVVSNVVPFALLRPLSAAHTAAPTVPNRVLLVDRPIQVYTTVLASAVYALTLAVAYGPILRSTLLLKFGGIPSIEPSQSLHATLLTVGLALALGAAARTFIFIPAAATGSVAEDDALKGFDPVSATLGETLLFNAWGFRAQTKVTILRTLVVMFISGVRTFLQCGLTIARVELSGSAVYASVWAAASLFAGIGLGLLVE